MFEVYEHNKSDCIKLLNMIICEIPFIKSFGEECLLERLLNLISIITNAFDNTNSQSLDSNVFDTEEEREAVIREWLLRHYNAKSFIDDLNFNDLDDRIRVTVLIFNILFKLRHSFKDIEQYLKDCDTFVQFDQQLNHITRFDKLLEILERDANRWKSEARYFKVKYEESKKLIDKYQQNEIFNYNSSPRNQNLYKSRISIEKKTKDSELTLTSNSDTNELNANQKTDQTNKSSNEEHIKQVIQVLDNRSEINNMENNYICIECDKSYSTKFEYNIHVLKDHKNVDISQIVCNSNNNSVLSEENKQMTKKCKNVKKRVFRCHYHNCRKSFYKSTDLKTHFVRHQPKIDRLLCVYSDYTNHVLMRRPSLKNIRMSSNYENKPKNLKFKSNDSKTLEMNYNLDLNLNVDNYEFNNGFGIDSHFNHSNPIQSVPFCKNEGIVDFNSINSFDFVSETTDTDIDLSDNKIGLFSSFEDDINIKTYSRHKSLIPKQT